MLRNFYIMRHAHSQGNEDHSLYVTSKDHLLDLSDSGYSQCATRMDNGTYLGMLDYFGSERFVAYCSPFLRAKNTLLNTVLKDRTPHKVKYDIRLREHSFGKPKSVDEMVKNCHAYYDDLLYYASDCGEQGLQTFDRVQSFLDAVNRTHYEHVVIVTHGALMNVFGTILTGMDLEQHVKTPFPKNLEVKIYTEIEL